MSILICTTIAIAVCWQDYKDALGIEVFPKLLFAIVKGNIYNILIPFIISLIITFLYNCIKNRFLLHNSKVGINLKIIVLSLAIIINSTLMLQYRAKMTTTNVYPFPSSTILTMINNRRIDKVVDLPIGYFKRLNANDFILKDEQDISVDNNEKDNIISSNDEPNTIQEPKNFDEYVRAILYRQYAEGKTALDYYNAAYEFFVSGKTNNDWFSVGLYLNLLGDSGYAYQIAEITEEECQYLSIDYYNRWIAEYNLNNSGYGNVYNNLAMVYRSLNDKENERKYLRLALKYNDKDDLIKNNFINCIEDNYSLDTDHLNELITDLEYILNFDSYQYNLELRTLISYLYIYSGNNLENAENLLMLSDKYYNAGHFMTKILLSMCLFYEGKDNSDIEKSIEQLEKAGRIMSEEERIVYADFLILQERYEYAFGYLEEKFEDTHFEEKRLLMMSNYFLNDTLNKLVESNKVMDSESIYAYYTQQLDDFDTQNTEEYRLAYLVRSTLDYERGEFDIEEYRERIVNLDIGDDIKDFILAVASINTNRFTECIEYCDRLLKKIEEDNLQITLDEYYIRLIKADAHIRCAKNIPMKSEEWLNHVAWAQHQCDFFKESSKGYRFMSEAYAELEDRIKAITGDVDDLIDYEV